MSASKGSETIEALEFLLSYEYSEKMPSDGLVKAVEERPSKRSSLLHGLAAHVKGYDNNFKYCLSGDTYAAIRFNTRGLNLRKLKVEYGSIIFRFSSKKSIEVYVHGVVSDRDLSRVQDKFEYQLRNGQFQGNRGLSGIFVPKKYHS